MNATAEIAKGETKVLMNAAGQRISLTQSNLLVKVPDIRFDGSVTQSKPEAPFAVDGEVIGTAALIREKETIFAEKDAKIIAKMTLAPNFDEADIKSLTVSSELFSFKGKAKITELQSRCVVAADGESTLDCERVTQLLNAQGIDEWTLTGRSMRPFSFKAPVAGGLNTLFAEGRMSCAVAVASGQGMGLKAGPSDASVKLSEGLMKISYAPALNEGKLKVNPVLSMERNNLNCTVPPKTRVLENVQLSQEMLDGIFIRLFPLFKGSVAQQGSVTLDVTLFEYTSGLPIEQGLSADILLQLDDVKVLFGKTLQELLVKMQSKSTLWEQKNVTLRARILNGRIIMDPVTLVVDRHPISFSGWVDTKGAINYMIEVTLTERLLGPKGGKAIGKVVKVPVTGTINDPKIELNALLQALAPAAAEIIREEVQDHAKDFLENLRKELKKKKDKEKGKD
jgi:translocation and assembly module TamB